MPQIEAPVTGAEIDTSDPFGSLQSIGMAIVGAFVSVMVFGVARYAWNQLSKEAPGDQEVEFL